MLNFSIKELRATGQGKKDGVILFDDGLNLIFGRSNTGKTWILKSINYLFGSSKIPIPAITGYTRVSGIFDTARFGRITIQRDIGSSKATVLAESDEITDGEYETDHRKTSPLYLNELWLRILGVNDEVMVPKNENYERERLSWANLANVFFTDEEEVDGGESIIEKNATTATALLSSLYFLLTGDWKKDVEKILTKKERTASKNAVTQYIDQQLTKLENERAQFASALDQIGSMDVEKKTAELSTEIEFVQEETERLLEENSVIANRIYELQQRRINAQVLTDRYDSLLSQYKADLQRIGFIYQGEKAVRNQEKNERCPFCGGHVESVDDDNSAAIEAEAKRIASEIAMILLTKAEVEDEKTQLSKLIDSLDAKRREVQATLDLRNQEIVRLEANLDMFAQHASLSSRIEYIDHEIYNLGEKRAEVNKKETSPEKYKARAVFEGQVGSGFTDLLNNILKECNFKSGYASWDFSKMDVDINGVPKSENSGKGYRSYLNSAVSLMLYSYFNSDDSIYKPGFMMIDTPLLGFDEDEALASSPHLKNGLYEYILSNVGAGQVIIVDNLNMRPELDFVSQGAKVTVYNKNEDDADTYGFLPDWRTDL